MRWLDLAPWPLLSPVSRSRPEDSAPEAPAVDHDTPFTGHHSTSPASREAPDMSAARGDHLALHCQCRRQIPELDVPASMFDGPETIPDWMRRRETWKAEDRG